MIRWKGLFVAYLRVNASLCADEEATSVSQMEKRTPRPRASGRRRVPRFACRSLHLGRFQSDLDDGESKRIARSSALQNTLDRPRPKPSHPSLKNRGIPHSADAATARLALVAHVVGFLAVVDRLEACPQKIHIFDDIPPRDTYLERDGRREGARLQTRERAPPRNAALHESRVKKGFLKKMALFLHTVCGPQNQSSSP